MHACTHNVFSQAENIFKSMRDTTIFVYAIHSSAVLELPGKKTA